MSCHPNKTMICNNKLGDSFDDDELPLTRCWRGEDVYALLKSFSLIDYVSTFIESYMLIMLTISMYQPHRLFFFAG